MARARVGLLFGGTGEEHPVSVKSAREVAAHLDTSAYEPFWIGITTGGAWLLCDGPGAGWEDAGRPVVLAPDSTVHGLLLLDGSAYERVRLDVVFPVLHGRLGEDGAVQGLLELASIPYVGCDVQGSAVCMDKSLAYTVAAAAGVATPRFWVVGELPDPGSLPYPVFVKPARSGSSYGVTRVERADDLAAAIDTARQYDATVLVEEAVAGSEIGCAILGDATGLVVGEVDRVALSGGFFRIHQEESPETGSENATFVVPADIPAESRQLVRETAVTIYRALGCRGLARVDLFLTDDGGVVLNEVNTMPGLTSYSRYPRMMAAAGLPLGDVVDRLLTAALDGDEAMRDGFAYVDECVPGIRWDAKYATWDNFTGRPVDGYSANRIVGTTALCAALDDARRRAASVGLGLLLWDGYRPQRAVDDFLRWSTLPEDGRTKRRHYPAIDRADMFDQGYVATRSGHTRGSTVDLTVFRLDTGDLVAMGGHHDLMDAVSHHGAPGVSPDAASHRRLLLALMEASGFRGYDCEWWHYTLVDEPYPATYFDFPVG